MTCFNKREAIRKAQYKWWLNNTKPLLYSYVREPDINLCETQSFRL
jgi:hypothetical protein